MCWVSSGLELGNLGVAAVWALLTAIQGERLERSREAVGALG